MPPVPPPETPVNSRSFRRPAAALWRWLRLPFEIILVPLILLDEMARPFYRPFLRWVASWQLVHRLERWIAARHRLVILVLLAIPFTLAEPLKIVGLFWMADGHVKIGTLILVFAYLMSFVVVERIYHAGRDKLLTLRWFAWLIGLMVTVRAAMLDWARSTAIWRSVMHMRERAETLKERIKARLFN